MAVEELRQLEDRQRRARDTARFRRENPAEFALVERYVRETGGIRLDRPY